MELTFPDQIAIDNASSMLIDDVGETARRVNEHRPLPSEVLSRIQHELLGERVFSSNAIEGNTLDLRETVRILKTGQIDAAREREGLEVRNLGEAIQAVSAAVRGEVSCYTPAKFLELHAKVLRDIDDTWAGRYREHRVMITGAARQPPSHDLVPALIELVMERLRRDDGVQTSGIVHAAWAHWAIARIHPFHDGNGRMARLWQDLVLFRANLTCAIIRPEDRREYLDALGSADEGEFNPLVQLVAYRVAATFDRYLRELRRDRELDVWAKEVAGEADDRISQKRQLGYLRWARRMEQLRSEFELCAGKISERSQEIGVQVRKYDLIDQQRWENIRLGIGAERTWFFSVEVRRGASNLRYYFFFGKHYWSELDDDHDRSEQRVCLLISESESGEEAQRLDQLDNTPISLREIFVVDDNLVRKRRDEAAGHDVYDREVSALRIAQDFLRDVILRRLR